MLDQLSKVLRMQVQPLTKFRQLCDMEDQALLLAGYRVNRLRSPADIELE